MPLYSGLARRCIRRQITYAKEGLRPVSPKKRGVFEKRNRLRIGGFVSKPMELSTAKRLRAGTPSNPTRFARPLAMTFLEGFRSLVRINHEVSVFGKDGHDLSPSRRRASAHRPRTEFANRQRVRMPPREMVCLCVIIDGLLFAPRLA